MKKMRKILVRLVHRLTYCRYAELPYCIRLFIDRHLDDKILLLLMFGPLINMAEGASSDNSWRVAVSGIMGSSS